LSTILGENYVNVDDTTLMVLDPKHKKGRYRGHLWCFTGTRGLVAYTFTESWEAEDIAPYIGAMAGFIQCDDYKGYSKLVSLEGLPPRTLVPPERRLGCMMHVRRRFHDALKLGDRRAAEPIAIIRELYLVEAEARSSAPAPRSVKCTQQRVSRAPTAIHGSACSNAALDAPLAPASRARRPCASTSSSEP
jgi:transposase